MVAVKRAPVKNTNHLVLL